MSSHREVSLGDVQPAGSRHLGRRSAVLVVGDRVIAGTASGTVVAFDRELTERWRADGEASVVSLSATEESVVAGERGPSGAVRAYDTATGTLRWRYETAADVGDPTEETRFCLPFVADIVTTGHRAFVAARRYERDGDGRHFESAVYAFGSDGSVRWRYETDASPISLAADGDRVAVAYNRCPGGHQHGLVALDADTGEPRWTWDPGTDGQRRVGDVALLGDGLAVASHGDYCGYALGDDGAERWRVDLATPERVDGERVYAYPNHVYAAGESVVFVTGNTYPADGRQTDALHPDEHTAFGCTADGNRDWSAQVGGFASGIGGDGSRLAVPGAQHFRTRDATAHGLRTFDVVDGQCRDVATDGVVTDAAIDDGTVAAIEEPVAYHDDGRERGAYRLLVIGEA